MALRTLRLSALALALVAAPAAVAAADNEVIDRMFTELPSWPCSRLITEAGAMGCGSESDEEYGNGGTLYPLASEAELDALLAAVAGGGDAPDGLLRVSLVLDNTMLSGAVMAKLVALNADLPVDNVLVTVASEAALPAVATSSAAADEWVTNGDGLNDLRVPFPVTRLKTAADSAAVDALVAINAAAGFGAAPFQHAARFQFYGGKADVTSSNCLEIGRCDPVGGLSVWGTAGALLDEGKESVLLATRMDANAFFHDLAFGRDTAMSGLAATLLAARALAGVSAQLQALPRQVLVAAFQAESFDRAGSRRFVRDVGLAEGCATLEDRSPYDGESCRSPLVYGLVWERLHLDNLTSVVVVDQVVQGLGTNSTYFLHAPAGSAESAASAASFAAVVAESLARTPGAFDVDVAESSVTDSVPPTSLDSFLEADAEFGTPWAGSGLVLSGYDAAVPEANEFFQSRFDRSAGSGSPAGAAEEAAAASRLAQLATLLARHAFVEAGGLLDDAVTLIGVDEAHAAELWGCLSEDFACALVADTLGLSVDGVVKAMARAPVTSTEGPEAGGPATLFTSVYVPTAVENGRVSLVERFVRNYLVLEAAGPESTGDGDGTDANATSTCSTDLDCLLKADADANATGVDCELGRTSRACVQARCRCANVFFHDAVSPYISLSGGEYVVDAAHAGKAAFDALFTEPVWEPPQLTLYFEASRKTTIALVTTGVVTTAATWVLLARAKRALSGTKLKLS